MVLPDEAGLIKSRTLSLFSQPDPPGLTGTGQETKTLGSRSNLWIGGRGSWGVVGCKLAEEMESEEYASAKKVQVQMKMEPLIGGCRCTEPRRKSYEPGSVREWTGGTVARHMRHF